MGGKGHLNSIELYVVHHKINILLKHKERDCTQSMHHISMVGPGSLFPSFPVGPLCWNPHSFDVGVILRPLIQSGLWSTFILSLRVALRPSLRCFQCSFCFSYVFCVERLAFAWSSESLPFPSPAWLFINSCAILIAFALLMQFFDHPSLKLKIAS